MEPRRSETFGSQPMLGGASSEALAPLLAGARARGLADAFDLLGLAVVFIDGDGVVLHVNADAASFLGADLAVVSAHLVGGSALANVGIQDLVATALGRSDARASLLIAREDDTPLRLDALAFPADPTQLLRAVIVLSDDAGSVASGVARALAGTMSARL